MHFKKLILYACCTFSCVGSYCTLKTTTYYCGYFCILQIEEERKYAEEAKKRKIAAKKRKKEMLDNQESELRQKILKTWKEKVSDNWPIDKFVTCSSSCGLLKVIRFWCHSLAIFWRSIWLWCHMKKSTSDDMSEKFVWEQFLFFRNYSLITKISPHEKKSICIDSGLALKSWK